MAKVKVSRKRLPSYNYVQIMSLMFIAGPLICVGDPGLTLTLGGDDDDIRNWLIWLRREDPRPCKLCANCILRKFWLFPFFSWFVCDKDTGYVCLAMVRWSDEKEQRGYRELEKGEFIRWFGLRCS